MTAALIFESASEMALGPKWAALLSGFAAVDWWGNLYLTRAGAAYLAGRNDADS